MKKRLIVCLLFIICLGVGLGFGLPSYNVAYAAASDYSQGSGTEKDPYIVSTAVDLFNMRYYRDCYFKQEGNIDLSQYDNFLPIGSITSPFYGTYDGQQYAIRNLNIERPEQNNVGLFSFVNGGTVRNVKIVDSNIVGNYNVGAIAGVNKGNVLGCIVEAKIRANNNVGGIVGNNSSSGIIDQCANKGEVNVENGLYAGGITGSNYSVISNSYNIGSITGNAIYAGGIAGVNNGENSVACIQYCFNLGSINGSAKGAIVGDNLQGKIIFGRWADETFRSSAFDTGTIDENTVLKPSTSFRSIAAFDGWYNFNSIWEFLKNASYPTLKCEYVKISDFNFAGGNNIELQPEQSYKIVPVISPIHATIQNLEISVLENSSLCNFDPNTSVLTINADAVLGRVITLKGEVEGIAKILNIKIVKIPVTGVEIFAKDNENTISQTTSIQLNTKIYPANASYQEVKYTTDSSYANVSENGVVTLNQNTPVDLSFNVTATSVDNTSVFYKYKITVVKEKVSSVEITNSNSFKVTESLSLSATVLPQEATNKNISFTIVSDSTGGASIKNNILTAPSIGTVVIKATADGVSSADFIIEVLKEPATTISFTSADSFKHTESLLLTSFVLPSNATNKTPAYEIIGANNIGAIISEDNVLTALTVGTITVRASVDEIYIDKIINITKESVISIELVCDGSFKYTEYLELSCNILPLNATYTDVVYSIIGTNDIGARIEDNILYADAPGTIVLRASADEVSFDKIITVLKEPVTDIILTNILSFKHTESLELTAVVSPTNATYKTVSYSIVGTNSIGASIVGNVLTASGIGSVIIRATADGFSKDIPIQVEKEPVTHIEFTNVTAFKHNDYLKLKTEIIPFNATNIEVVYSIVGDNTVDAVLTNNILTAERPGTIIIRATADGISKDINITVEKEPVTSIVFNCAVNFKHTLSLILSAIVSPANATYKEISYSIVGSNSIGAKIDGNILTAEKPGVITVRATADGISVNQAITIEKEPVINVELKATYLDVAQGEALQFTTNIYPLNATNKSVEYYVKSGLATIDANGLLKISIDAPVGSLVEVYAVVDGVQSDVHKIIVGKIKVDSVNLTSSALSARVGSAVDLEVFTNPSIVSNPGVSYEILGDAYVNNGVLWISTNAEIGSYIEITAIVDEVKSNKIVILVEKEPVSDIMLTSLDSFKVSGNLILASMVYPTFASYKDVSYEVVSASDGNAFIVSNVLYASEPATIIIKATADGTSKLFTITAIKEPVSSIALTSATSFKVTGSLALGALAMPANATYKTITYSIVGANEIGAKLYGNILTANLPGSVTIRIAADDFHIDVQIHVRKEPVTSITFTNANSFKVTDSLALSTVVFPANATYKVVTYSIVGNNESSATINSGILTALRPGLITVRASADGYYYDLEIEILREPVTDIIFTNTNSFKYTQSLTLSSIVTPVNATYKNIVYSISGSNNVGAVINGNVLTATQPGTVTIMATADGVSRTIDITVLREPVTDIVFTNGDNFKHTEFLTLEATAYPNNATFATVTYTIVSSTVHAEINGNILTADAPRIENQTETIVVMAKADGVERLMTITVKKEPVTNIVFNNVEQIIYDGETIQGLQFKHTGSLTLSTTVSPNNATYPDVEYKALTNSIGAVVNGNILTADKPGKITVVATADEISREITVIVLKEPVTDIEFINNDSFVHTGSLTLETIVYPYQPHDPVNATYPKVRYEVVGGNVNARVDGNILTADAPQPYIENIVIVRVIADDISREMTIKVLKEDVTKIEFVDLVTSFKHTLKDGILLNTVVSPANATFKTVAYSTTSDIAKVEFINGEYRLTATAPGDVKVTATVLEDGYSTYENITVEKEPVTSIIINTNNATTNSGKVMQGITYNIGFKNEHINYRITPDNATYSKPTDVNFLFEIYNDSNVMVLSKRDAKDANAYFTFDGVDLTIKTAVPVGYKIRLFIEADGVSAHKDFVIMFVYEDDVLSSSIATDGLFEIKNLGKNVGKDPEYAFEIVSYVVTVTNGSNVKSATVTNYNTFWLLLYKNNSSTLLSNYSVNIKVTLKQNGFQFSYDLPYSSFAISKSSTGQVDDFNAKSGCRFVSFDFSNTSSTNFNREVLSNSDVQWMYAYGRSGISHNNLNFTLNNSTNAFDLFLSNFNFTARSNYDAIKVTGTGILNLFINGTVSITGGNGSGTSNGNGLPGKSGIYCTMDLNISGSATLNIYGGNGAAGATGSTGSEGEVGTRGKHTSEVGFGKDATAGAQGGMGGTGGNGGYGGDGGAAISARIANVSGSTVSAKGGNGGDGGQGGKGGKGGKGGEGGSDNSGAIDDVGDPGKGGKGGTGGTGGSGGYGGYGGSAHTGMLYGSITCTLTSGSSGSRGAVGEGGDGGDGGKGGSAGSVGSNASNGATGDKGASGTN